MTECFVEKYVPTVRITRTCVSYGHTTQVCANTDNNKPLGFLHSLTVRLWVSQTGDIYILLGLNFFTGSEVSLENLSLVKRWEKIYFHSYHLQYSYKLNGSNVYVSTITSKLSRVLIIIRKIIFSHDQKNYYFRWISKGTSIRLNCSFFQYLTFE